MNITQKEISSNAVIEESAVIGKGTTVGDFCYVGKNVTIGENNTIEPYVIIESSTVLGDNNLVKAYAVVGSEPQDIKTISEGVSLEVGSNNTIGSYALLSAGTDHGGMVTRIGDGNNLGHRVHIGHDVQMSNDCVMHDGSALGGHITVSDGVTFEESAAVHQFVNIGRHATIKSDAALTQDIPPFCLAQGNRAKIVGLDKDKTMQILGTELSQELRDGYDYMNESGHTQYEYACIALNNELPKEVKEFYAFIADSQRGVPFARRENVN